MLLKLPNGESHLTQSMRSPHPCPQSFAKASGSDTSPGTDEPVPTAAPLPLAASWERERRKLHLEFGRDGGGENGGGEDSADRTGRRLERGQ